MTAEQPLTLNDVTRRAVGALQAHDISFDRTATIGQAIKDAATAASEGDQSGLLAAFVTLQEALLDPRVVAVRDQYFKIARISHTGELNWELKDIVVAKEAVEEIDRVNRVVYNKSLLPSHLAVIAVVGYDDASGERYGQAVFGVPGSVQKFSQEKAEYLLSQDMSLSTRYNSLVSLNLELLLTSKHSLKNGRWLCDSKGVLYAENDTLQANDTEGASALGFDSLALGSRNQKLDH